MSFPEEEMCAGFWRYFSQLLPRAGAGSDELGMVKR